MYLPCFFLAAALHGFQRLYGYCSGCIETVRDRDDGEFPCALWSGHRGRLLEEMAHVPDVMVPGLPVYPAWRQQERGGAGITFLVWGFLNGAYQIQLAFMVVPYEGIDEED